MPKKVVTLERFVSASVLSNTYERVSNIEKVWKIYQKQVQNNFSQTRANIFTFFFYFLTGFLRVGLRTTLKFKLSNYFVNEDVFKLYVGQTHFINSTNLPELESFINSSASIRFFSNPLMFIRIGRCYIDRATLTNYVMDVSSLLQTYKTLESRLDNHLVALENLFLTLYTSCTNYYKLITFSY